MTIQIADHARDRRVGSVNPPADRPALPEVRSAARLIEPRASTPRVARHDRPIASGRGARRYTARPVRRGRAVAACPAGSAAGPYRMSRWQRLAMTVIVTAAIIVGSLTTLLRPAAEPMGYVTVQPGETLVSVASRAMPDWDAAEAAAAIGSLNDVSPGSILDAGEVLRIPGRAR